MKYIKTVLEVVLLIALCFLAYRFFYPPKPDEPVTITETVTETVTITDTIKVYLETPAIITTIIDTIYVNDINVADTIATAIIEVNQENISGTIEIAYSYSTKQFKADLRLISESEEITHHTTTTVNVPTKNRLVSIIAGSNYINSETFAIGAGIELAERLSIMPVISIKSNFGLTIIYTF